MGQNFLGEAQGFLVMPRSWGLEALSWKTLMETSPSFTSPRVSVSISGGHLPFSFSVLKVTIAIREYAWINDLQLDNIQRKFLTFSLISLD